ncbi:MAG: YkgJ family cysteine cluster protein [Desulfomonile sp.]|nr:YkgJ family cysteine cluster protein [Desulfomonile sp.]
MTLKDHIARYLELVARVDSLFQDVARAHPDAVACGPGCDECCSVYFELSLIEAFVVSGMFRSETSGATRDRALQRAAEVEPVFCGLRERLGREAGKAGVENADLHEAASRIKIRCPLNEDKGCVLYEHRPITCRLYGVPQKIGERTVACPRCGFRLGGSYPTVDVNEIQILLFRYSAELLNNLIGVAVPGPPGLLFSMATALRTDFNRQYFLALQKDLC